MDKNRIERLIPKAYKVIKDVKMLDENEKINKKFRSQISSFGASVATGSLLAAIAFFQEQGSADVEREKLIKGIFELVKEEDPSAKDVNLFQYVSKNRGNSREENKTKELILDCAAALKLAMNLYEQKE